MMHNKPNFTPRAQRAIEMSKKIAGDLNQEKVTLEHLFLGILQLKAGVVHEVLISVGLDPSVLINSVSEKINSKKTLQKSNPRFDRKFKQVLEISNLISKNFGHDYVGIEHILLAMLKYENSPINQYFAEINIPQDLIIEEIKNYFKLSISPGPIFFSTRELDNEMINPFQELQNLANQQATKKSQKQGQPSLLEKYTTNLNQLAVEGKLDKIVGRDSEILEMCETLCRRSKNNPVLLGEAGVGKTALVEGLSQMIVQGTAPEHILEKTILSIDLPGMVAGTKYRGQFEERIKGLLDEAIKSDRFILFIDEIHTLVGAGSAEGTMDAANILKPLLARGQLRCIGATTHNEYKKTILKDAALDRRFQPIKCLPPSAKETREILSGIVGRYEKFHHVEYSKEALDLIVELANRYLPSKQFPDKAIDILDRTGAKVKIKSFTRPENMKEMEIELEELMKEEEACSDLNKRNKLVQKQDKLLEEYSFKLNQWAADKFKNKIKIIEKDIICTVSQMTSIPKSELALTDSEKFLNLQSKLSKKIIGQEDAIESICQAILRSKSGLRNECKPIGSFLLLGQTGLGKTYTAKQISKCLLGEKSEIIHLDMSEYSEKTATTRLTGSAPGYVGYEEGSILVDKITKNPYSVILFDEIEKAHPDVIQSMLQILEEGRLTDGLGRVGDFRNSIIIVTGNIGSELAHKQASVGFGSCANEDQKKEEKLIEKASEVLKPEFVNRLTEIVMFKPFSEESLLKIINLELNPIIEKLKKKNISILVTKGFKEEILNTLKDSKFGARPISRIIQKKIEDPLATLLISKKLKSGNKITFKCQNSKTSYTIKA